MILLLRNLSLALQDRPAKLGALGISVQRAWKRRQQQQVSEPQIRGLEPRGEGSPLRAGSPQIKAGGASRLRLCLPEPQLRQHFFRGDPEEGLYSWRQCVCGAQGPGHLHPDVLPLALELFGGLWCSPRERGETMDAPRVLVSSRWELGRAGRGADLSRGGSPWTREQGLIPHPPRHRVSSPSWAPSSPTCSCWILPWRSTWRCVARGWDGALMWGAQGP